MTVGKNVVPQVVYRGDQTSHYTLATEKTRLPVPFPRFSADDLTVEFIDDIGNIYVTTAYTIENLFPSSETATVVFTGDHSVDVDGVDTPVLTSGTIQSGWSIVISFTDDPTQPASFREGSRTTADNIEKGLDRLTMSQKQISDEVNKRSIRMPANVPDNFDAELKGRDGFTTSDRDEIADRFIQINETGTGIEIGVHREDVRGDRGAHASQLIRIWAKMPLTGNPAASTKPERILDSEYINFTITYDETTVDNVNVSLLPSGLRTLQNSRNRDAITSFYDSTSSSPPTEREIFYSSITPDYDATLQDLYVAEIKVELVSEGNGPVTIRRPTGLRWTEFSRVFSYPRSTSLLATRSYVDTEIGRGSADSRDDAGNVSQRINQAKYDINQNRQERTLIGYDVGRVINGGNNPHSFTARWTDEEARRRANIENIVERVLSLKTSVDTNTRNIADEENTLFNEKLTESGLDSRITGISNTIGQASDDRDGVGSIFQRLASARRSGGGGGGVTPAELDAVKRELTPHYARLLESDESDRQNPASAFGGTVESFQEASETDLTGNSALFDVPITRRTTGENQEVPRSGTLVSFGDSLKTYNSGTSMIDKGFPAANSLKFFKTQDYSLNVERINAETGQFEDVSPRQGYPVQGFVAYTRGLDRVAPSIILGKPDLLSTFLLDLYAQRTASFGPAPTSQGQTPNPRDPYTLKFLDNGVERRAAILFLIPTHQPYSQGTADNPLSQDERTPILFRDSGYIGIYLEGSTHELLELKFGPNSEDSLFLSRKAPSGTAFLNEDNLAPGGLDRVPIPFYEARLGDNTMKKLFGGNAITSNGHAQAAPIFNSDPSMTQLSNSNLILSSRIAIFSPENNLSIAQQRLQTSSVSIVTAEKVPLDELRSHITGGRAILSIDQIQAQLVARGFGGSGVVKRQKFFDVFDFSGSGFADLVYDELEISLGTTRSIRYGESSSSKRTITSTPSFALNLFSLLNAKKIILFFHGNRTNSLASRSVSEQLYQIQGATKILELPEYFKESPYLNLDFGSSNRMSYDDAVSLGANNAMPNPGILFFLFRAWGLNNLETSGLVNMNFRVEGIRQQSGSGTTNPFRYLTKMLVMEERYISSDIVNWQKDYGWSPSGSRGGISNTFTSFDDSSGAYYVSLRNDRQFIAYSSSDAPFFTGFSSRTNANDVLSYEMGRAFDRANGSSTSGQRALMWRAVEKCTVDVELLSVSSSTTVPATVQMYRNNVRPVFGTGLGSTVGSIITMGITGSNSRFRVTLEKGDYFYPIAQFPRQSTSNLNLGTGRFSLKLSAFAL